MDGILLLCRGKNRYILSFNIRKDLPVDNDIYKGLVSAIML